MGVGYALQSFHYLDVGLFICQHAEDLHEESPLALMRATEVYQPSSFPHTLTFNVHRVMTEMFLSSMNTKTKMSQTKTCPTTCKNIIS